MLKESTKLSAAELDRLTNRTLSVQDILKEVQSTDKTHNNVLEIKYSAPNALQYAISENAFMLLVILFVLLSGVLFCNSYAIGMKEATRERRVNQSMLREIEATKKRLEELNNEIYDSDEKIGIEDYHIHVEKYSELVKSCKKVISSYLPIRALELALKHTIIARWAEGIAEFVKAQIVAATVLGVVGTLCFFKLLQHVATQVIKSYRRKKNYGYFADGGGKKST